MSFDIKKHTRYWRMCSSMLPHHYISSDASRIFLGFFVVAALDILDIDIPATDRERWISWIYSCQTPEGGFRGFTGTDLRERRNEANRHWDPANLPNTFFALATLLVLGDDLSQVKRDACLEWLPRLQREDGSFGEILAINDTIEGGRDLRYCCCAAGIAYILHNPYEEVYRPAFDELRLVDYIESCQSYDGGYGESPMREPHSGLNYCAIATLALLRRLKGPAASKAHDVLVRSDDNVRWMVARQTTFFTEDEDEEDEGGEEAGISTVPGEPDANQEPHSGSVHLQMPDIIGLNGRANKIADTCYCFWNAGALTILESLHLLSIPELTKYLLQKVQHTIGGFGKGPDSPPDVLHSYLGLAALSLFGMEGVKPIDATLCISRQAAANLQHVGWRQRSTN